ncbi:MAG: dTMP kinase [Deltaproteobacteria bacterium]|nr:dTMP kinase [Deltaproteobacteria bacterium]
MKSKRRGKFIVLEGADGSGTTTQANDVAKRLRALGVRVVVTCEPTSGAVGSLLRRLLATTRAGDKQGPSAAEVALLFAADRLDHLRREIKPALARGEWVISDRFVLSSIVYQGVELPARWVRAMNHFAGFPDLTLLIDVPEVIARRRRTTRGGARERFDAVAFQRSVVARYRALASGFPRLTIIDGSVAPGEVTNAILRALRRRNWIVG